MYPSGCTKHSKIHQAWENAPVKWGTLLVSLCSSMSLSCANLGCSMFEIFPVPSSKKHQTSADTVFLLIEVRSSSVTLVASFMTFILPVVLLLIFTSPLVESDWKLVFILIHFLFRSKCTLSFWRFWFWVIKIKQLKINYDNEHSP